MKIIGQAIRPSGGMTATIEVTYPEGATLTCSCDGTVYTATTTTGSYQFKVHKAGVWIIKAILGSDSSSEEVTIFSDGQTESVTLAFAKIYGISRDTSRSSTVWTRTDEAVGMTATASVGTTAGSSSFSSVMPWAGIQRETLGTGDVMVKIPKFYYQRYLEGKIEYIKIADKKVAGFDVHPLFNHGGVECEYVYVGAYKTSESVVASKIKHSSKRNTGAALNRTRAQMRNFAAEKGAGWGIIDIATVSAIQMLILVEFANNDVQSVIGKGYSTSVNTAPIVTGTCDSVPNLTGRNAGTDGRIDVVWRGIEGFWGSTWEWVDGINVLDGAYYVCNDRSKYADNVDSRWGYELLSYAGETTWSTSYIEKMGVDVNNPHVMLPIDAGSAFASGTSYYADACWTSNNGWVVCKHGGCYNLGAVCGIFAVGVDNASSYYDQYCSSRLLYIPA